MIELADEQSVREYLSHIGFGTTDEKTSVSQITGGVSNHVWRVVTDERCLVLKQPLEKLATEVDWFSGTERIHVEVAALRALAEWVPEHVPEVIHEDLQHRVCVMSCAPAPATSWKDQMMAGTFNADIARQVGELLATIHRESPSARPEVKEAFSSLHFLEELRIDPFHRYVTSRHPDLEEPIGRLVEELKSRRVCFVHGDYSPKNLLLGAEGELVLIDCEVAHWGNPVFDVAYCLGHLLLKGWALGKPLESLESALVFLEGYGAEPEGLIRHLALMLLARIDGKSTVDYVTSPVLMSGIRSICKIWIADDDERNPKELITTALLGGSTT
jgi:aminoglycoside phosphotransferase (APT) family kinase protein